MLDRYAASGLRRPGMSALRIITGMTGDEFAAPGTPPLPSTPPVGRAGRASQPCGAGMALCDKRRAVPAMARAAMPRAGRARPRSGTSLPARRPECPPTGTYDA
jgi:hypothetical protein